MDNWALAEKWWNYDTETLKFRIRNDENEKKVFGITQAALECRFGSDASEDDFDTHAERIIEFALSFEPRLSVDEHEHPIIEAKDALLL